jgi:hypothetical protein
MPGNALLLGSGGGIFEFTDNLNGTFKVEALAGGVLQGSLPMITGSEFILAVKWGTGGYVADSGITEKRGDPTSFVIDFVDGENTGSISSVDVTPGPATESP